MVLQILTNISRLFVALTNPVFILSAVLSALFPGKNSLPTQTPTPTQVAVSTPSASPTKVVSIKTQEPESTLSPVITGSSEFGDLTYPSAKVIGEGSNYLKMGSSDSPDKVTSYYKSKIDSLKPKSKVYAQTTTNGQVLNKLAFSQGDDQITIEVKSTSPSGSEINVSRD